MRFAGSADCALFLLGGISDAARIPLESETVQELRVAKLGAIFQFGMDLIFAEMKRRTANRY